MGNPELMSSTLRQLRQACGLTAKEVSILLAHKGIDISEKTLLGYENGVSTPKVNTFLRLCEVYKVADIMAAFGYDDRVEESPLRNALLANFDRLNSEGQERLVETSDDMVASGKYIKNRPSGMVEQKA